MERPVLVIMAAGMGSRYGGLKQMDKITDKGEIIIDFSLYDAYLAGFRDVIFIIKKEIEEDFKKLIEGRADKHLKVHYVFQDINNVPEGFNVPADRVKPWGTCHAVLSAKNVIKGPFAVINADDYYGPMAFQKVFDYLSEEKDNKEKKPYDFCMAGYNVENTLTENGEVSRGVCKTTEDGYLDEIVERTKIRWVDDDLKNKSKLENVRIKEEDEIAFYEEKNGDGMWHPVSRGTPVSMNFWGFTKEILEEMEAEFPSVMEEILKTNPLKGEFLLPFTVDRMIKSGKATVKVLEAKDRWYGVTYKEDKETVVNALQSLKDKGFYPEVLWR